MLFCTFWIIKLCLDLDPCIRIFLRIRIRIQRAKIMQIQIRILSTGKNCCQTSLQFCHAASFRTKLRCLLSYFFSTLIRCVSNWIQLADSAPNKNIFLIYFLSGWKNGGVGEPLQAPSLMLSPFPNGIKINSIKHIIRDFPSNFSCSIFFFLLVSCFYVMRPLQIVHVTLSCGAGRRDTRRFGGGRVWGISVEDPCFPSF